MTDDLVSRTVERTERVSASFIKELMRRAIQFALPRSEDDVRLEWADVEQALEELLVRGGSLNRKLLGAAGHGEESEDGDEAFEDEADE